MIKQLRKPKNTFNVENFKMLLSEDYKNKLVSSKG